MEFFSDGLVLLSIIKKGINFEALIENNNKLAC